MRFVARNNLKAFHTKLKSDARGRWSTCCAQYSEQEAVRVCKDRELLENSLSSYTTNTKFSDVCLLLLPILWRFRLSGYAVPYGRVISVGLSGQNVKQRRSTLRVALFHLFPWTGWRNHWQRGGRWAAGILTGHLPNTSLQPHTEH